MNLPDDQRDYFVQREEQERDAARRSTDVVARRVHLALADRYAARVRAELV